jgi:hypothetical protein
VSLQLGSAGSHLLTLPSPHPTHPTPCLYASAPPAHEPQSILPLPFSDPTEAPGSVSPSLETVVVDLPSGGDCVGVDIVNGGSSNLSLAECEMKQVKTKATIGVLATLISYVSISSILKATHPDLFVWRPDDRENDEWVATSRSWWDRKACRWLGVCGGSHAHWAGNQFGHRRIPLDRQHIIDPDPDWSSAWHDGSNGTDGWSDEEKILREIPDYVMEHAPLVHLFSGEQFWPCDIAEHLYHITPQFNYTPIQSDTKHLSLKHLDDLNQYEKGRWVYLTSNDNVEERPEWLEGEKNIPIDPSEDPNSTLADAKEHQDGRSFLDSWVDGLGDMSEWYAPGLDNLQELDDFRRSQYPTFTFTKKDGSFRWRYHEELKRKRSMSPDHKPQGGRSDAPAVLIAVDKGHGVVDAFWFFFYSFNLGNVVFNVRFGNHVGDWEHTMIRFHHGKPKAVFFSEHNFGSAYSYEAVEKIGKRPVIYSATGTHAMYATPGLHPYVLPWGILHDQTDRGPLWDPALNSHAYTYEPKNETLRASNLTPHAPTGWFHYAGRWGDKFYPLGDKRQYRFVGQYHYVSGPLGPKFKKLDRKKICQGPTSAPCVIKHWIGGTDNIRFSTHLDEDDKEDMET